MEDCPKVGVFWSHNGRIRAGTALVKDGEDDGFFINYPFSHYQYWNILQKNYVSDLHGPCIFFGKNQTKNSS